MKNKKIFVLMLIAFIAVANFSSSAFAGGSCAGSATTNTNGEDKPAE